MERQIVVFICVILLQGCTQVEVFIGGDVGVDTCVDIDAPLPMWHLPVPPPIRKQRFVEKFYNTKEI